MHISIGKPATETLVQHYQCDKGHKVIAAAPITIGWYGDIGKQDGFGPPICPHCLIEFVRTQFPMAQVMKPERLQPILPAPSSAVILARPCPIKGCILAAHSGSDHMSAAKQLFQAPTSSE